jgi:hypothetical protein
VGQRHRGQRLAFGPEQRQGQPAQRREHRRAGQQHRQQPQHEGQQRQAAAVEMPREQKAGGGEAAPVSTPTQARPAPRAEAHRQDREADRHQRLHRPHRQAVGQLAAGVELAGDEAQLAAASMPASSAALALANARCLLHRGLLEAAAQGGEWPLRSARIAPNMASARPRCWTSSGALSMPRPWSGRAISMSGIRVISTSAAEAMASSKGGGAWGMWWRAREGRGGVAQARAQCSHECMVRSG